MRELQHPPNAASLLESMRSLGYSVESALADLIDNSISANARKVSIEFRTVGEPYVALLDDGNGMSSAQLEGAMRHGSQSPLVGRSAQDLGRYGLGLKTASISQCRRMTVISLKDGELSGYVWDMDVVIRTNSWTLLVLDEEDISPLPHVSDLRAAGSGTIVLWQRLDRLCAGEISAGQAIDEKMDFARQHLSLVFHRYLAGESSLPRLSLCMNSVSLKPVDPFLTSHRATQRLDDDAFTVEGQKVHVKPFILPHLSKLSREDVEEAGGADSFRVRQGFYVYRHYRLIIWGTWFHLGRKDELSKLARVRVDIPNSLDHLWTLDIKKSVAAPPEAVRTNLRRIIRRIRDHSSNTINFKGKLSDPGLITTGWNEVVDRIGVRYEINRGHPTIKRLENALSSAGRADLEGILRSIETTFPADALYARMASEIRPSFASTLNETELADLARTLISGLESDSSVRKAILDSLHLIEPFSIDKALAQKIAYEISEK